MFRSFNLNQVIYASPSLPLSAPLTSETLDSNVPATKPGTNRITLYSHNQTPRHGTSGTRSIDAHFLSACVTAAWAGCPVPTSLIST